MTLGTRAGRRCWSTEYVTRGNARCASWHTRGRHVACGCGLAWYRGSAGPACVRDVHLGGGCGDYRGRAGGLVAMSGPPVRFTCRARVSRHPTVGVARAEGRCATAARGRRGSTTGLPAGRVTRARPPRRGPVACNVVHSSRIHGAKHAMPAARARAARARRSWRGLRSSGYVLVLGYMRGYSAL